MARFPIRGRATLPSLWLALLAAGCADLPADPTREQVSAAAKSAKPVDSHTLLSLDPIAAQTGASARAINSAHTVAGWATFADPAGGERITAFVWSPLDGDLSVRLLPAPTPDGVSTAYDVNGREEVAGTVGTAWCCGVIEHGVPAVWSQSDGVWAVRTLEGPGEAHGINDAGELAGRRRSPASDVPVFWTADGSPHDLPLTPAYEDGVAWRLNDVGDAVGWVRDPRGLQVAALWIRRGPTSWSLLVLSGGDARDLSDRLPDGQIVVVGHARAPKGSSGCCQPARWTVSTGSGAETGRTFLGTEEFGYGIVHAVTSVGEMAGFGATRWTSTPEAAWFSAQGAAVKLPKPRSSPAEAFGLSPDGWFVGAVSGQASIWRPR